MLFSHPLAQGATLRNTELEDGRLKPILVIVANAEPDGNSYKFKSNNNKFLNVLSGNSFWKRALRKDYFLLNTCDNGRNQNLMAYVGSFARCKSFQSYSRPESCNRIDCDIL